MKMKRSRKAAAAAALGASVVTGGVLGAVFVTPMGVSAQDATTTTITVPASDTTTAPKGAPSWLTDALDQLVTDGTLDQAQRDAVESAIEAAKPARGPGGDGHGPGGRGGRGGRGLDAAATALGITQDELRAARDAGQTLADVAASKGVELQTVVDAIVAEMNTHIDEHLANGDITQEQADARKAEATQRATDMVNGVRPSGPPADAPATDAGN